MSLIKIRPATPSDLPYILEIFNHAILNSTAVYSYTPYTPEMMEVWYAEKLEKNLPVFVSTKNDAVTGFVTYGEFRSRPAYKYTMEHSIYVHPEHRQQGIAKVLMEHIIQIALKDDVHALIGGIDADNEVSIQFHQNFGFKNVGHLKEVGFKFGKWLDLVFMQLTLETPHTPTDG